MTEGIPAVKQLLCGLKDSAEREPVFTWLLRADEQVRTLQGAYGWVVQAHEAFLRSLQQTGDELGWHPHLWRRDLGTGSWVQELQDVDWQVDMLERAHADLTALPGYRTLTGRLPARRENLFDWYVSPRAPFQPSRADYRRPAREGEG